MINDLNDTHHKRPKLATKHSKLLPLRHINDIPIDDSFNSDSK